MRNSSQRAGQAQDSSRTAQSPAVNSAASPSSSPSISSNRRRFLLALGAGGAGAAAVATRALAGPVAPTVTTPDADASQGYRETDHVRDYYATTRI